MATSEYVAEKGGVAAGNVTPLSGTVPVKSHRRFGASLLAPLPMVLNDIVAIILAFGVALIMRAIFLDKMVRFSGIRHSIGIAPVNALHLSWFAVVYVFVARRYGLYGHILKSARGGHELRMTAQACFTSGMLLCGALYLTHDLAISRILVIMLTLSAAVSLCIRRAIWRQSRYRQYERGLSTRNIVILGTNPVCSALGQHIQKESRLGYTMRGHILAPGYAVPEDDSPFRILGGLEEIRKIVRKHFIDEVIVAETFPIETVIPLLKEARDLGIDVRTLSGYYTDLTANSGVDYLGSFPLVSLHRNVPRVISTGVKRAADIGFSLLALIAAAPAMLAIAIAIRLQSDGPVIYVAERIGKRGRVFHCFKFRTMVANADQLRTNLDALNERDGILFKVKNDPRITRLGRFLRKYSLDELPQFFNVLRGEMSLVGPRPPLASEVEKYQLEHLRRLEVLPGLTGLWQVQARQDSSFEKYIALDTAYVENWSFWLDLKILCRTAEVVLRGTGV